MSTSSNSHDAAGSVSDRNTQPPAQASFPWLPAIAEKLEGMRYGGIHLIVRDSRVIQIEFTESHRFDPPCPV